MAQFVIHHLEAPIFKKHLWTPRPEITVPRTPPVSPRDSDYGVSARQFEELKQSCGSRAPSAAAAARGNSPYRGEVPAQQPLSIGNTQCNSGLLCYAPSCTEPGFGPSWVPAGDPARDEHYGLGAGQLARLSRLPASPVRSARGTPSSSARANARSSMCSVVDENLCPELLADELESPRDDHCIPRRGPLPESAWARRRSGAGTSTAPPFSAVGGLGSPPAASSGGRHGLPRCSRNEDWCGTEGKVCRTCKISMLCMDVEEEEEELVHVHSRAPMYKEW